MSNIYTISFLIVFYLLFSGKVQAQEDVVVLADGRQTSGLIVEEIPFSLIRIQTANYQIRTYAFEEVSEVFRPKGIKGYWDVVYLKNGGVVRGFIKRYEWAGFLEIEDERGSLLDWPMREIRKINKEPVPDDAMMQRSLEGQRETRKEIRSSQPSVFRYGSTIVFMEAGGQVASNGAPDAYPGLLLNLLVVYRIEDQFSIGVGAGADVMYRVNGSNNSGRYVFGDARVYFPRKNTVPYLSIAAGYDWYRDGILFNPGVGIKWKFWRNRYMNLNLGIKMHYESQGTQNDANLPGVTEAVLFKLVVD
ncbi:MAG: hypothetical protein R3C61_18125 [Bacteroidia bacterium]